MWSPHFFTGHTFHRGLSESVDYGFLQQSLTHYHSAAGMKNDIIGVLTGSKRRNSNLIIQQKHKQHQIIFTVNKDLLQMCYAQSIMVNQQLLQIYVIQKIK